MLKHSMLKHSMILVIAILSITTTKNTQAQQAQTRHLRTAKTHHVIVCDQRGCSDRHRLPKQVKGRTPSHTSHPSETPYRIVTDANANVVGGRPPGCPRAYCGCEASRFLFGEIRPELNLAANWIRKFPRTTPAPRMVAARQHHVMVLLSHVEGDKWLVHDGNSGRGLTREHVVSIKGFVIVDPYASRTARN